MASQSGFQCHRLAERFRNMAVKRRIICDDCAPCAQGCCCKDMFTACVQGQANCDADCSEICRIDIAWKAPSDCLTSRASAHGGIKQYEVFTGGCPDPEEEDPEPDRIFDGEDIEDERPCDYDGYTCDTLSPDYEEPLIDRDGLGGGPCGIVVAKGDELLCIIVRGNDDAIITQCVVCPEVSECVCSEPECVCDCGSSSSSGSNQGSASSGGASSGGASSSGNPPAPPAPPSSSSASSS